MAAILPRPQCVLFKELKYTVAYYSVHVYGPLWFHFDDTETNRTKQAWEKLKACMYIDGLSGGFVHLGYQAILKPIIE